MTGDPWNKPDALLTDAERRAMNGHAPVSVLDLDDLNSYEAAASAAADEDEARCIARGMAEPPEPDWGDGTWDEHLADEQAGDRAEERCMALEASEPPLPAELDDEPDDPEPLRHGHPLDEVEEFIGRYVAFPSDAARVAVTLWAAHTHAVLCFESTPRLAVLSPEPGSGKTRVLEVLELLVPLPVQAVNVTPAYLFRKVGADEGIPTVLFDEIDTVFGTRAKDNEDVRGLLNAGHRRGAVAGRCVVRGKIVETEELPAFAPVAMAGLGDLPDTLMSRSVIIRMRRRAPGEHVEPFRRRLCVDEGQALAARLAAWTTSIRDQLTTTYPDLPDGITDRNADVWEALVAIADAAGGDWPRRARVTAVTLVTAAMAGGPSLSLGVRLLSDLQDVFAAAGRTKMPTTSILFALHGIDEAPWSDLRGKPLDARGLARRLDAYQVKPRVLRDGDDVFKGYDADDLHDPWTRYVTDSLSPSPLSSSGLIMKTGDLGTPAIGAVTSVTPATDGGQT